MSDDDGQPPRTTDSPIPGAPSGPGSFGPMSRRATTFVEPSYAESPGRGFSVITPNARRLNSRGLAVGSDSSSRIRQREYDPDAEQFREQYASYLKAGESEQPDLRFVEPQCGAGWAGPRQPSWGSGQTLPAFSELHNYGCVTSSRIPPNTVSRFAAYMANNPVFNMDGESARPNALAFDGSGFSWQMFPVIFNYRNGMQMVRKVVPFAVIISTVPWEHNTAEGTEEGGHEPVWLDGTSVQTAAGTLMVYIDTQYIARNSDSILSVLSAVRATADRIKQRTGNLYVTISPFVSPANYSEHVQFARYMKQDSAMSPRRAFGFTGASLGLAVTAAMLGLPNMAYTGYLSSFGTNKVATDDIEEGSVFVNVFLGSNMVEIIEEVPAKIAWAMHFLIGLVIPLNNTWHRQSMARAIYNATQQALRYYPAAGQPAKQTRYSQATGLAPGLPDYVKPGGGQSRPSLTGMGSIMPARSLMYSAQLRTAGQADFSSNGSVILPAVNISDMVLLTAQYASYVYGGIALDVGRTQQLIQASAAIEANVEAKMNRQRAAAAVSKMQAEERKLAGIVPKKRVKVTPEPRPLDVSKKVAAARRREARAAGAGLAASKRILNPAAADKVLKDIYGLSAGIKRLPKAYKEAALEELYGPNAMANLKAVATSRATGMAPATAQLRAQRMLAAAGAPAAGMPLAEKTRSGRSLAREPTFIIRQPTMLTSDSSTGAAPPADSGPGNSSGFFAPGQFAD